MVAPPRHRIRNRVDAHGTSIRGVATGVTFRKRLLDMLPALLVFAVVSLFASYVAVAYIVHDPLWLQTLAHARDSATPPAPAGIARPAPG